MFDGLLEVASFKSSVIRGKDDDGASTGPMKSFFWPIFWIASAFKALLIPASHSTDFEVHRNWLAITYTLPLNRWYLDVTSQWTLDYPPFFAYFEWVLAQIAQFVDPQMLLLHNHNYASSGTIHFQCLSVVAVDIVYAVGVLRCLRALRISRSAHHHFTGEVLLLLNCGLIFVDHIHFQYNGFLFGILLLSISFLLEERYLLSAFTFAVLLNFKHIFLYMAPAFAAYLLRFYCLEAGHDFSGSMLKLAGVGLTPFVLSFGPFWNQLPQVLGRLFPFKRGLTHAYWAPNFWALYNTADKAATIILRVPKEERTSSTTAGLVQEFEHVVLPSVSPSITFLLTAMFMLPIVIKLLCYTSKSESKLVFLRAVVLCSCASFMFGWHVHEKAILMCLIPLILLCLINATDAKYCFLVSVVGYFSLFPLLFHPDLIIIRYSVYLAYISFMYAQIVRIHKGYPQLHLLEVVYMWGFLALPIYEHLLSRLLGLHKTLPFMPLLLTSLYCSVGVSYFFIRYYIYALVGDAGLISKLFSKPKSKTKSKKTARPKSKLKSESKPKPKSKSQ